MFRTVPLSTIGVFHCKHSNGIFHKVMLTACEQDPARKQSVNQISRHLNSHNGDRGSTVVKVLATNR